jgi:hypothetical protein
MHTNILTFKHQWRTKWLFVALGKLQQIQQASSALETWNEDRGG